MAEDKLKGKANWKQVDIARRILDNLKVVVTREADVVFKQDVVQVHFYNGNRYTFRIEFESGDSDGLFATHRLEPNG